MLTNSNSAIQWSCGLVYILYRITSTQMIGNHIHTVSNICNCLLYEYSPPYLGHYFYFKKQCILSHFVVFGWHVIQFDKWYKSNKWPKNNVGSQYAACIEMQKEKNRMKSVRIEESITDTSFWNRNLSAYSSKYRPNRE